MEVLEKCYDAPVDVEFRIGQHQELGYQYVWERMDEASQ
jgi:hypothetical protein